MSTTDLQRLAHRLLIIGFDGLVAPASLLDLVRGGAGGVILFARNVQSPQQVAELNRSIKAASPDPLISSVDQEGGRVARLRAPWTVWPPMRRVGDTADEQAVRAMAGMFATELKSCGFDVDYSPVLDVDSNPANPIIGDRAFSRDPERVARLGAAMIKGLQEHVVGACGKHFPGHGDTSQDSHLDLPRLPHGLDRLRSLELIPFAAAVKAGVSSIMTAHVVFEALDPGVPATMSEKAINGVLRGELGYQGLVISDDLEMKAVHERFAMQEVVERSLNAGVDAFLACRDVALQHEVLGHIVKAVEAGRVPRARVEEAALRMDAWNRRYACAASSIDPAIAEKLAGIEAHRQMSQRLAGPAVA